ncbi:MAG: NAD-binding protein [Treponema sp.]|nr:NAD-binding protein [Treponema sp.]
MRFQAVTLPGRTFSIITIIVRMCLFGTVTAAIASFFMDSKNQKNRGFTQLKKLSHHFIICGWRPEMEVILDTVMESNPELTADQIVLVNNVSSKEIGQLRGQSRFKELNYVSGDYSHQDVLKRACIQTADRALVIFDQSDGAARIEVDSRTILSVLTMKNMNPKIYVSAELFDAKLESHLKLAHCDEIILTTEYEYHLLANASCGQGYSNIIHELVSSDRNSGIVVEDIPPEYFGKTYGDYAAYLPQLPGIVGEIPCTGHGQLRRGRPRRRTAVHGDGGIQDHRPLGADEHLHHIEHGAGQIAGTAGGGRPLIPLLEPHIQREFFFKAHGALPCQTVLIVLPGRGLLCVFHLFFLLFPGAAPVFLFFRRLYGGAVQPFVQDLSRRGLRLRGCRRQLCQRPQDQSAQQLFYHC